MTEKQILLIEDEAELAQLVRLHLESSGCNVRVAADGESGLSEGRDGDFDLVVLDWMLPGIDGLEVCRRLRAREPYLPILMLTARSAEVDRVLGLEVGADDYVVKPFSPRELMARIHAILRRVEALRAQPEDTDEIAVGDLRIDPAKRRVRLGDRRVELTAREFDLLRHFARHPGRVYTRAELLDEVWGYHHDGYEHTVNSHINRLRAKLEDEPGEPRRILTVWGVGYKLAEPAPTGAPS